VLTDDERSALGVLARSRTAAARLVTRARIVLAAADGTENQSIAAGLNVAEGTVRLWRNRFASQRLPGIERDQPGRGRKIVRAHEALDTIKNQ
jgi:transposase